ncbi:MAG: AI-2E family transporter [Chloroflexi bacterium]|nr:AI-2E family transporter [Chloroflexota bacterium]
MTNPNISPTWNTSTKLIVSLTLVTIAAGLLIKFQAILPPMIVMILLAYLFNPIADFLSQKMHLPWKIAVTLVYILAVILLVGLLTLSGVGLIQQTQNLISVIQDSIQNIPALFDSISGRKLNIGPFILDLRKVDLGVLGQQLIGSIEPMLSRTGTMVGTMASSAANFLGWTLFVLLVSYFVLAESDGLWRGILQFNIPGYQHDLEQMGKQLSQIWNAFLRGQIIVMGIAALVYTIALSVMGVNYALGLALLAGLARFVPYVGPFILWIILALVSYFQEFKPFGLTPWIYALTIVLIAWVIDGVTDNIVMPRIMASALKVHPAAVLVAAIIALELLGILGVIIAAPMLATMQLIGRYFTRKLFDLDPWQGLEEMPPQIPIRQQIRNLMGLFRAKFKFR